MSRENVEIARRAMDALNRFDLMVGRSDPFPTLREFCDPDVEWDFSRRRVDPEVYYGYDRWVRIAEQFGDAWQELHLEIEEIIDAGDSVVLFTNMSGTVKVGHHTDPEDGPGLDVSERQDRPRPILRGRSGSLPGSRGTR
jgi:hypothetical protein